MKTVKIPVYGNIALSV